MTDIRANFNQYFGNFPKVSMVPNEKGDFSIGGKKYDIKVLSTTRITPTLLSKLADIAHTGKDLTQIEFVSAVTGLPEESLDESQIAAIFETLERVASEQLSLPSVHEKLEWKESDDFKDRMLEKYEAVEKSLKSSLKKVELLEEKVQKLAQKTLVGPLVALGSKAALQTAKEELHKRHIEKVTLLAEIYQGRSSQLKDKDKFLKYMIACAIDAQHMGYLKSFSLEDESQKNNHWYLCASMLANSPEAVTFYLEDKKVDPNQLSKDGLGILEFACIRGSKAEAAIIALLKGGARVDLQGKWSTPIHEAFRSDVSLETVKLMLDKLEDINLRDEGIGFGEQASKESLLHYAVDYHFFQGKMDKVDLLLKRGIDVNLQDKNGEAPLHQAVDWSDYTNKPGHNYLLLIQKLIAHGAVVDLRNIFSQTALHLAAEANKPEIILELLKAGANPQLKDAQGLTPLHYFVRRYDLNPKVLKAFLKAGVDLNAKDENGNTPLHTAVRYGSVEGVRWLMEHGAQPMVRNNEGKLPGESFLSYVDDYASNRKIRELLSRPPKA